MCVTGHSSPNWTGITVTGHGDCGSLETNSQGNAGYRTHVAIAGLPVVARVLSTIINTQLAGPQNAASLAAGGLGTTRRSLPVNNNQDQPGHSYCCKSGKDKDPKSVKSKYGLRGAISKSLYSNWIWEVHGFSTCAGCADVDLDV